MGISYKLEKFEGPLDLLLHLIEKNKVDIYDIPIVDDHKAVSGLCEPDGKRRLKHCQRISWSWQPRCMDIKSRMLLPVPETEEEGEEEDPRAELVARLLEYKKYKLYGTGTGRYGRRGGRCAV